MKELVPQVVICHNCGHRAIAVYIRDEAVCEFCGHNNLLNTNYSPYIPRFRYMTYKRNQYTPEIIDRRKSIR